MSSLINCVIFYHVILYKKPTTRTHTYAHPHTSHTYTQIMYFWMSHLENCTQIHSHITYDWRHLEIWTTTTTKTNPSKITYQLPTHLLTHSIQKKTRIHFEHSRKFPFHTPTLSSESIKWKFESETWKPRTFLLPP